MTEITAKQRPQVNWGQTLFNPLGTSTRIEFTRAWTLLFFLQVAIVVGPWFVALLIGTVGGDPAPIARFGLYASPIIFVLTTLCSYIIHTRRLRDASKPTWLAVLILIPLLLGFANFFGGVSGKAGEFEKLYQEREQYLADPIAYAETKEKEAKEKRLEVEKKREEAAANKEKEPSEPLPPCPGAEEGDGQGETGQAGGQNRGNWGNQGGAAENPLPDQIGFVLRPNLGAIQGAIIPLSAILAIWSLVYVARVPLIRRYEHQKKGNWRLYLSYAGRIGEKQFWFGLLALFLIVAGVYVVLQILSALSPLLALPVLGLTVLLIAFTIWAFHALLVKRLHDFGRKGLMVLVPFAVGFILAIIIAGAFFGSGIATYIHCGMPQWFTFMMAVLVIVFVVVGLLHFFWIAFSDPEQVDNKYGPAPEWFEETS